MAMRLTFVMLVLFLAAPVAALEPVERVVEAAESAVSDPGGAVEDPEGIVDDVQGRDEPAEMAPPQDPGFADGVRDGFDGVAAFGLAGLLLSAAGVVGFGLVTRYVSPKEALKNPQRAMLYGYVRGHPGSHLKQLSEEFAMKTSSILWHIRKLESAELVRSERANGFRVFYPVEGGIEMKRVSRAITALHNENALRIYESVQRNRGATVRETSDRLSMHGGTVRWHLRKLREFGLVEELVRDDGSRFFSTPMGQRALQTLQGAPVDAKPAPRGAPIPE